MTPDANLLWKTNAATLRDRLLRACAASGRNPGSVSILPVTKNHPAAAAAWAAGSGFPAVGENRVQEAATKRSALLGSGQAPGLRWELIGHLQSNKARLAAGTFDRIQTVDSARLASTLGRIAAESGRRLPILLQVNTGGDPAKFGAEASAATTLLDAVLHESALAPEGLMTIAPLLEHPTEMRDAARRAFASLRTLRDDLSRRSGLALAELSMGMSGDLEEAVAEGATLLRIGTALFGTRTPPPPGKD